MKIVLVGFMGSGKTTVSKLLGEILSMEVVEVDDLTIGLSEFDSIAELIAKRGEPVFRDLESEAVRSIVSKENVIVSAGGGTAMSEVNRRLLSGGDSVMVFLETSFETSAERVRDIGGRPLFENLEQARVLYQERQPIYRQMAQITVNTDRCEPIEIAQEISKKVQEYVGN